ncbi:hypothetical protein [Staphylococcus phage vB_SepM_ phiIPLA-C1C]|jgi:hypothetical protein|uniref:Uncharacterized protein n=1 Tax=Staphylococcus phage vB_SepM_ phiIPLA-C1C TaxID=1572704 RepID=A0A0D3MWK5_9CAUD|nr:hypothetical protein AVU40_gp112 [Staphylococcus phage phiIPLA-C1C]AJA42287.1 hypothetical protein [Staphylococcus phage phiIPLA-C1C]QLF86915.1 hypothetical protein BESEP4_00181 [Staphylococcus phage vB_SepM_BE04]
MIVKNVDSIVLESMYSWLLDNKIEEYKVVKEDIYSNHGCHILLKKGTILLETKGSYEDSLGTRYVLSPKTVEVKLEGFYENGVGFKFEEHKINKELYKIDLT